MQYKYSWLPGGRMVQHKRMHIFIAGAVIAIISIIIVSYSGRSGFSEPGIMSMRALAKPGSGNTGPTDPAKLVDSPSITITQDGTVLENVNVKGYIYVKANNVTIRNFKVTADINTLYAVRIYSGYSGTVLEDGEIDGNGIAHTNVIGEGFVARRLNVHSSGGDGFKLSISSTVEGCWIHHLGLLAGAHADGIQISGGSNLKITGNNFDMPVNIPGTLSNAAVFIKANFSNISGVLVSKNWMNGGNYTVYSINSSSDEQPLFYTKNVKIIYNKFGRDYKYGLKYINSYTVWKYNTWDDNGKPAD